MEKLLAFTPLVAGIVILLWNYNLGKSVTVVAESREESHAGFVASIGINIAGLSLTCTGGIGLYIQYL
jgi:hypothetical protein